MENVTSLKKVEQHNWQEMALALSEKFADTAGHYDDNDLFVAENYQELKSSQLFSSMVPETLGGGGASYADYCNVLRVLAQGCGSTALALSMHSHLVAANLWKLSKGQPVEPLLKRIADEQLVLISTGASDWLNASGSAEKVDGGYRINGRKIFASGCLAGDLLITSAVFDDPNAGSTVLHFPLSIKAEGVSISDTWHTMGMRGTGSHDVLLNDVFVPEQAVALTREQGVWHPFFNVVCTVAMPLIMSVYVGIAEAAAKLTRESVQFKKHDPHLPYLLGEMETSLTTAQMALREMISIADGYDFEPSLQTTSEILQRKTIAANAVISTLEKCMETAGGGSFFRSLGLERLLRDIHGAQFHPLPEKRQYHFSGSVTLGLPPLG
ncbi:acyl-CoA dehydrogenase family protein [Alteromonadaceae bacterium BrNp21-10]|nr:acyl-CoA dehydrogenase family protein [Alteromonadaceae bacterium BrNp21-10]